MKSSSAKNEPHWIWGTNKERNFFRKKFVRNGKKRKVCLKIAADTIYWVYLNEQLVGKNIGCAVIDTYEVGGFMLRGDNLLAVEVVNRNGCKGLAFELRDEKGTLITGSDITSKVFGKEEKNWRDVFFDDSKWAWAEIIGDREPWRMSGDKLIKIPSGLSNTPFGKAKAKDVKGREGYKEAVKIVGDDYEKNLNKFPAEVVYPVKIERLEPNGGSLKNEQSLLNKETNLLVSAPGGATPALILDFGREVIGFLNIKFKDNKVGKIRVVFGETLRECIIEPPKDWIVTRWLVNEYEITGNNWEEKIRQGFRYVKISFKELENVKISSIFVRQILYDVEYAGYFNCDDPLLNKIWETSRHTLHLCMQEYYLDGIKRDRLLWTGDAYLEALVNYYLFGDLNLFRYCWARLAQIQFRDGALPAENVDGGLVLWDYVGWYVIALYDYLLHSGDTEFVKLTYPVAEKAVRFLLGKMDRNNLIYVPKERSKWGIPYTLFSGMGPEAHGEELPTNCVFYRALQSMAEISKRLGHEIKAKRYEKTASKVKLGINKKLWNESKQMYLLCRDGNITAEEDCQGGNAMAVLFGIAEGKDLTKIIDNTGKRFWNYKSNIWPNIIVNLAESLFMLNKGTGGIDTIKRFWGYMVEKGATTFWETLSFSEDTPRMTGDNSKLSDYPKGSFCHGWASGAAYLLQSRLAGIRPISPGFKEFIIDPRMGELKTVQAVVPIPAGLIAVNYVRDKDGLTSRISVPWGCTGKFVPKRDGSGKVLHLEGGHTYEFKVRVSNHWGNFTEAFSHE